MEIPIVGAQHVRCEPWIKLHHLLVRVPINLALRIQRTAC